MLDSFKIVTDNSTSITRGRREAPGVPAELIAFDTISKRFGGTHALRDVSLQLMEGEILALLGENGAGKSTLIKILAGIFKPTSGEIRFRGGACGSRSPSSTRTWA